MQDDMLSDAVEQMLAGVATPAAVRAIEAGGSCAAMWQAIEASGFCDALVPQADGGAGLGLVDTFALFEACGRHAVPIAFGPTVMARAVLAMHGMPSPTGQIAIAADTVMADQDVMVSHGAVADHVLISDGQSLRLIDAATATCEATEPGRVDARMRWSAAALAQTTAVASTADLRCLLACVLAAQMSGAMRRLLAMSLQHANDRTQFGRAIGKFQAIQHQLSVMAEESEAARMGARMACATNGSSPDALLVAVAKARAGEAAVVVASIAHAVHGAIGITADFDLQLFTRRLHAWRMSAGSESFWQARIGRALLDSPAATLPDFVRTTLSPQDLT